MKKTITIVWMDCISCETVLHDALEAVPTIKVLTLSHKTGKMDIEYKNPQDLNKLESILKANNYSMLDEKQAKKLQEQKEQSANWEKRIEQIVSGIGILTILWIFTKLDLMQYIGDYGPNMWFGVAFLVGLVACGSSCLAITGGIVVSYTESLEHKTPAQLWRIQALFHAGRIGAFVGLGALLWYLGKGLSISPTINGIIMWLVACILVYVGMQILGIVPNITSLGFHLPKGVEKTIKKLQHPNYAPVVWFLTFFLPCGFTQSMQLFAMQSGSASQWAMILWAYALGTLPLLLWLGMSAGYFKEKLASFNKIVAVLLIFFWLLTLSNAYKLIDVQEITSSAVFNKANAIEKISRKHLGNTLEPKAIALKKNTNYEITINPERNGLGCKGSIRLPDGSMKAITKWNPITFQYKSDSSTRLSLTCPMGSAHGTMVVE